RARLTSRESSSRLRNRLERSVRMRALRLGSRRLAGDGLVSSVAARRALWHSSCTGPGPNELRGEDDADQGRDAVSARRGVTEREARRRGEEGAARRYRLVAGRRG